MKSPDKEFNKDLFARIASKEVPSYIVQEDENFLAFLDVFPLMEGHVLVIPKKQTDYIFDLVDNEYSELFLFAKKVAVKMKKAIVCNRIAISVLGIEVPHTHIHLLPINQVADIDFSKPKIREKDLELERLQKLILER